MKSKLTIAICVFFASFLCLQAFRPTVKTLPVTAGINAPEKVKSILERSCYDCHSNQTKIRWYEPSYLIWKS